MQQYVNIFHRRTGVAELKRHNLKVADKKAQLLKCLVELNRNIPSRLIYTAECAVAEQMDALWNLRVQNVRRSCSNLKDFKRLTSEILQLLTKADS